MCGMHYLRQREHGDPGSPGSTRMEPTPDGLCSVEGCEKPTIGKQLCSMHLSRLKTKGDVGSAESLRVKDGRLLRRDGYVGVFMPNHPNANGDGYVLEHRLVMAEALGRPLAERENVHHINGVRSDNRPENLELWVRPQPSGQRVTDLVAWVVAAYPAYVRAAIESS